MSVYNDCLTSTANISNTTDQEPWPTSSDIILATFYGLMSLVIVVSNVGNLFALPHVTAELGANTVFLFRALALVDLLTGIFGSGGKFVDIIIHWSAGDALVLYTEIKSILSVLCINYSLLILGCVSLNRYLLIAMPYRYKEVTRRKMIIALVVVFIVGALQAFIGYLYSYIIHKITGEPFCYFQVRNCNHIYHGYIVIYLFIPIIVTIIITFTNMCLLLIVLDHKRRINKQTNMFNGGSPQTRKQRNIKGITILLVIVLTFYLCCAPEFVYDSYKMTTSNGDCLLGTDNAFLTALLFTNSCMNSFIYLFTMKLFRKVFKRTLTCGRLVKYGGPPTLESRSYGPATRDNSV